MQESIKRESLEEKLREELKWYTLYASDEEFDQKAVDAIMYLLDRVEPLEEGTVPSVEESWKRFLVAAGKKELLPVEDVAAPEGVVGDRGKEDVAGKVTENMLGNMSGEVAGDVPGNMSGEVVRDVPENMSGEVARNVHGNMSGEVVRNMPREQTERYEALDTVEIGKYDENKKGNKKVKKVAKFVSGHKIIAAAILVLMVLMVGNTIHVVANPGTGFFFWMKRDDSGVKMMTSPKGLDALTNDHISVYYEQDDLPEWAKEWVQFEKGIELQTQDAYELQYFESSELDNRQHVASHYLCKNLNKEIVVGVWVYWDKVSYFSEEFMDYEYVQSYEFAQKERDIYKKTEDTGKVYYMVCFYDGNCRYYVRGGDNLDEIKGLIEEYWRCVQNNS